MNLTHPKWVSHVLDLYQDCQGHCSSRIHTLDPTPSAPQFHVLSSFQALLFSVHPKLLAFRLADKPKHSNMSSGFFIAFKRILPITKFNMLTYSVWEEKSIGFCLCKWIYPRFAVKLNTLICRNFKCCRLKEELVFMLIFNQKSTWNSKVWLHSELDFIFSDFGTVVFTTLSMLEVCFLA